MLVSNVSWTQSTNELFTNANALYKQGKYKQAINEYLKIEEKGEVSSDLYYNIGNSYYKLNEVAPAIYNYEKALQLNPLNKDAQNNLIFAKRLALDSIEELPKSLLQKFNQNYLQKLNYNQWAWICVLFSFLAAILFLLFYFSEKPNKKRMYFVLSSISFLLLFSALAITFNQYSLDKNTKEAIVFSEEVIVKNAPTLNSNDVFMLHEGAKVYVLDSVDNWKKIKLADGKIGWLLANEIKMLNNF